MTNVLEMLEYSSSRVPDKTAVVEENRKLTYAELADRSRRIGSSLIKLGVSSKEPVGVYMEKGIDALCAFFGIVYAGGFYCMLNPELPVSRIKSEQEVLQAKKIITAPESKCIAKELFPDADVLVTDDLCACHADMSALGNIRACAIDTDPLYLNFTSGSTGIPKGILVCHRSVIDFMACFPDLFGITENDRIANQAPFDFDVSVKDIYSAICKGAELVIVPRQLFSAPAALMDYICDKKVTTMIWAVSALGLISAFHGLDYKVPENIKRVLFSGEVMPLKMLNDWRSHLPQAMFVNLYGPTEITCNCTYHILDPERDYADGIPIGRAFPNEDVFLVGDDNTLITGPGTIGKIMVRGTALALGYYRLPGKNAEMFIQNPLNNEYPETVYMTGDLGAFCENGELKFCGRADNQIKYKGHRIELEEVERAMSAIDGVERCCCIFDSSKSQLCGFYTGTPDKAEVHAKMQQTMPLFMVPGRIRKVDSFPLNKNGKTDCKALMELGRRNRS